MLQDAEEAHLRCKTQVEVLMENESAVQIWKEIRLWSNEVLEVPCLGFANLPPCPFARAAWLKNNVVVHVTSEIDDVIDVKSVIPKDHEQLHLFAWTDYQQMTAEEFNQWIEDQNQNHFGVWLMGFHPNATENPLTPEFEGLVEDDYAIILVQSLNKLVEASETLKKTKYYEKFPAQDMQYINRRKEIRDAWNEKASQENAQEGWT